MISERVLRHLERVEAVADYVYDFLEGALESGFIVVDELLAQVKARAEASAQRRSGLTVAEKAVALRDYYEEHAPNGTNVGILNRMINTGVYNISEINRAWDGVEAPGKGYTQPGGTEGNDTA